MEVKKVKKEKIVIKWKAAKKSDKKAVAFGCFKHCETMRNSWLWSETNEEGYIKVEGF